MYVELCKNYFVSRFPQSYLSKNFLIFLCTSKLHGMSCSQKIYESCANRYYISWHSNSIIFNIFRMEKKFYQKYHYKNTALNIYSVNRDSKQNHRIYMFMNTIQMNEQAIIMSPPIMDLKLYYCINFIATRPTLFEQSIFLY